MTTIETTVTITDQNGKTLGEYTVSHQGIEPLILNLAHKEKFPERNPLHKEALTLDDIKVGVRVMRHNVDGHRIYKDEAIVVGVPFQTKSRKYTKDGTWMVPVVTKNYRGDMSMEDFFLTDMGVVPYEGANGRRWWNHKNYTLLSK